MVSWKDIYYAFTKLFTVSKLADLDGTNNWWNAYKINDFNPVELNLTSG